MANLFEETFEVMEDYGKTIKDIAWVGSYDVEIPLEKFLLIANKEYDNGYGCQEVAVDLLVVFNDGSWLERGEYDGAESWEYRVLPERPSELMENPVTVIDERGYYSLNEMNKESEWSKNDNA